MSYLKALHAHNGFSARKKYSEKFLDIVIESVKDIRLFQENDIAIFVAGSLGRMEFGKKSDIDFFIITESDISNLAKIEVLGGLIHLNKKLNLPEFSNDGKFLKVHSLEDMIRKTGSPTDDHENLFTTRLLMILESKVIINNELYNRALKKIIDNYFKDKKDRPDFFPIYLLNDIIRYWRTLCLNYEMIRFDDKKPWRKKNINLKYSRMLTIFATILPLFTIPSVTEVDILNLIKLSPQERLAFGLEKMDNNEKYLSEYKHIIDIYESFLKAKEDDDFDKNVELKHKLDKQAEEFSSFLYTVLMDDQHSKYKRYLVI